jgi:carbonic anhydrase/acetyltransferase-like protein (isoleucine patch superfamily)
MPIILEVRGKKPVFGNNVFIAPNATVIGDVVCGDDCSFWFNAVIRGDVNYIKIGNQVNVQDNATLHGTFEKSPTVIGDFVSIGHNAIVHGCTLGNHVLVGMGAIVMDNAIVHDNVLIAAGSVVLENSVLESGYIYAGVPAKKIKALDENHMNGLMKRISENYKLYASWFKI